jgi:hypothetical protein
LEGVEGPARVDQRSRAFRFPEDGVAGVDCCREEGKLGADLRDADDSAGHKDGGVYGERGKVLPSLAVFEVNGDGKGDRRAR